MSFFEETTLAKTKRAKLSEFDITDNFEFDYKNKPYELFTDVDLIRAAGSTLVFDVESFFNYFLVSFKSVVNKQVVYFEDSPVATIDIRKLAWIMQNFELVGFNSKMYDVPIVMLALYGHRAETLKQVTNQIIRQDMHSYQLLEKEYGIKIPPLNHIDLIEVAPLKASLKLYGGRLHAERMQDIPVDSEARLTPKQAEAVRYYNINDLDNTILLYNELKPQLDLRVQLSNEYKQDLRSKSDAQIAEAVISSEIVKIKGYHTKRPVIESGTVYKYQTPRFIKFQTPAFQHVLEIIQKADFVVGESGSIEMPKEIADLKINLGECVYRLGIGGLHSSEKCIAHKADESTLLIDKDVASYYPAIILNCELYPKHLGKAFLQVYRGIVERRLAAKKAAPKGPVEQSLKIVINGSFGKLGNRYSVLYSPDLLIQVTVTGQLALLMLIEMLESIGIVVVSANTDGILIRCPKDRYNYAEAMVVHWQNLTGFETEETRYKAIYNRDVNNYIAIKLDGKTKEKGVYAERGSALNSVLSKNPESQICNDAVIAFLSKGVPIEKTINECRDIRRFVTIRNVKGGAEKSGVFLGRAVRWYYSTVAKGEINYITNGNKVPNTDNAMPLMQLPTEFPSDVDFAYYITKADEMLHEIGYYEKPKPEQRFLF